MLVNNCCLVVCYVVGLLVLEACLNLVDLCWFGWYLMVFLIGVVANSVAL